MKIGPVREFGETTSSFRFRYAWFSFKAAFAFGIPFAVLVAFGPNVAGSPAPLAVMFGYIGLPIAFGMSALAFIGFFIGGAWARFLEGSAGARARWPLVQFTLAVLFLFGPVAAFCLYWFFLGVTTLETQALVRGGKLIITPQTNPIFFWVSLCGWGAFGGGLAWWIVRRAKVVYGI